MSSGLDLAFLALARLRAVGWLNSLRLVHGLLEMAARLGEVGRNFVLMQEKTIPRGAPQLIFHVPEGGILSRRSLSIPSTCT